MRGTVQRLTQLAIRALSAAGRDRTQVLLRLILPMMLMVEGCLCGACKHTCDLPLARTRPGGVRVNTHSDKQANTGTERTNEHQTHWTPATRALHKEGLNLLNKPMMKPGVNNKPVSTFRTKLGLKPKSRTKPWG